MEFLIGGVAAMSAGLFSNPFDVVKTRMQLQGELKSKGNYTVFYRSVPHAVYTIAKNDGVLALQKGLVSALGFQLVCNSTRLGLYHLAESRRLTKNKDGQTDALKSLFYGCASGVSGAFLGSPLYLVKCQIQSSANETIAVGYQRKHHGTWSALRKVFREGGIRGLWRGWESSATRAGIGSAVQLTTFSRSLDYLKTYEMFSNSPIWCAFVASNVSGVALAIFMSPFDVISTRLYNQETDKFGRGVVYRGVIDCGIKIFKAERLYGLYKGVGPLFFRAAPHTVLSLIFWDYLKRLYARLREGH